VRISRLGTGVIALAAVTALVLSGCSAGGTTAGNSNIISVNGSEPQNPLLPANTNETGGGKIIDNIFAGLVYYDAEGAPVNEVAKSITTTDNMTYAIELNDGWTFTNGEKVTASSFVDAWQYGALLSNAQLNSYFYDAIEGFSYDVDQPLTGLNVVDDLNFTVTLSSAQSDFPLRLGYTAFFPLPSVAYDDIAAFGENPIGNGPYKLAEEGAWKHNVNINLISNPDYTGGRKPANGGLDIVFYASTDAAYADLVSDNLDVLDAIPDSAMKSYAADLGDRAINQPAAVFQSFTINENLPHFSGAEGQLRRQALSMAINRDEITNVIFDGTRTPARDFTSPVIDGWSGDLAGATVLDFNAAEAVKLWAEADALSPWTGSFQIAYNADGGHAAWVDAVTNSIKNTLGIEASGAPFPTFAELRTLVTDRTITTAFRTGWQADYPALANFLAPLYQTDAGSNDGDYSNAEVDALFQKGNEANSLADANQAYQDAQVIMLQDLPAIPLWYSNVNGGFSTLVSNVVFGWNSVPLYYAVTKG
jgi:oligopeptide transport system substrate-binding protein